MNNVGEMKAGKRQSADGTWHDPSANVDDTMEIDSPVDCILINHQTSHVSHTTNRKSNVRWKTERVVAPILCFPFKTRTLGIEATVNPLMSFPSCC